MVFIPLSDDNPLRSIGFQWVTIALIVARVPETAPRVLARRAGPITVAQDREVPGEVVPV